MYQGVLASIPETEGQHQHNVRGDDHNTDEGSLVESSTLLRLPVSTGTSANLTILLRRVSLGSLKPYGISD